MIRGTNRCAYFVCLKTGDHSQDGAPLYRDDPDALGRVFVGPYLAYEPELGVILEDGTIGNIRAVSRLA